jgi:ubiquinone/menaquinone biosynthesis C-methylase UbiE
MKLNIIQKPKEHYFNSEYLNKGRFISYWYQISEILKLKKRKLAEIGVGNKMVSRYLAESMEVITLDIDKNLNPDVVGTVTSLPFKENSFDIVLNAEVLEHLPFRKFKIALKELRRITKEYVLLTLPHVGINFSFNFRLPKFDIKKGIKIGIPFNSKLLLKVINYISGMNLTDKFRLEVEGYNEHYWEIGRKDFSLKKIKNIIEDCGFTVLKTFNPVENMDQQFFLLKKS